MDLIPKGGQQVVLGRSKLLASQGYRQCPRFMTCFVPMRKWSIAFNDLFIKYISTRKGGGKLPIRLVLGKEPVGKKSVTRREVNQLTEAGFKAYRSKMYKNIFFFSKLNVSNPLIRKASTREIF